MEVLESRMAYGEEVGGLWLDEGGVASGGLDLNGVARPRVVQSRLVRALALLVRGWLCDG